MENDTELSQLVIFKFEKKYVKDMFNYLFKFTNPLQDIIHIK